MKIGLLGGTFDPPHIGHLMIAEQAYVQLALESVWFAPVGHPPHKMSVHVAPITQRVEMTRLAIQGNEHFTLTLADVNRPTPHYITSLFEILVTQNPDVDWYLILGGDSLAELRHWYRPMRLLQLTRLAVAPRTGVQINLETLETDLPGIRDRVCWIDSPLIDLASHDLQRRIRDGLPLRYAIPDAVIEYIAAHHLYQPQSESSMDS